MDNNGFQEHVRGIAALDNPISSGAYRLAVEEGWVSRDRAAEELGVARSVAAFHLDKLVETGLLQARYERVSGRTGPGAGRPAKLYGRSDRDIEISLPPRHYDLAGSLLAEAVTRAAEDGTPVRQAVAAVAEQEGERAGAGQGRRLKGKRAALLQLLGRLGYQPRRHGSQIALLNCPFHTLAKQHRDLVCSMNLSYVNGLLRGLELENSSAVLAPEPGHCCVRIRTN